MKYHETEGRRNKFLINTKRIQEQWSYPGFTQMPTNRDAYLYDGGGDEFGWVRDRVDITPRHPYVIFNPLGGKMVG